VGAIHAWLAVGVVVSTAATDAVYVMFSAAVASRRRLPAATWSSVWYLLSAFAVISYAQLGIRMLRCARFLDRSVSLNDLPSAQLAPARSRRVKDYGLNIAERQLVQSANSDWPVALPVFLELGLWIENG